VDTMITFICLFKEEIVDTLINIVQWILAHKLRFASLVVFGIVTVIAYSLGTSYALIEVKVTGVDDISSLKIYPGSTKNTKPLGPPGLHIVPRSIDRITVASDDKHMQTRTHIDIPWYGFLSKTVTLHKDQDAEKIAYRSSDAATCATFAPDIGQLLYYSCFNPKRLVRYVTPANRLWAERDVINGISFRNKRAAPYLGGIIGIAYNRNADVQSPDIAYINSKGNVVGFNIPQGINEMVIADSAIFTDTDPTNNRFVFVSGDGTVFLATPNPNQRGVSYRKIDAPAKYNQTYNQTQCVLRGASVHCYYGKMGVGDMPDSFDWDSVAKPSIMTASFDNQTVSHFDINTPPSPAVELHATTDGNLYLQDDTRLYILKKTPDNTYILETVAFGVDTVSGEKDLLFTQDGGVFRFDPSTYDSYQIFYSPNVYVASVYQTNSDTFVIGYVGGDRSYTYAYKLLNKNNPGNRLIDKLPFDSDKVSYVLVNDLVGDKLFVRIYTPFSPPSSIDKINNSFLQSLRRSINDYLQSSGTSVSNIQFAL